MAVLRHIQTIKTEIWNTITSTSLKALSFRENYVLEATKLIKLGQQVRF